MLREAPFFVFKVARVNDEAGPADFRLMLDMKHLVEHHKISHETRNGGRVEDAADENGVVGAVEPPQNIFSLLGGPGEVRLDQRITEIFLIQSIENVFQIDMPAKRTICSPAATPTRSGNAGSFLDIIAQNESAVRLMMTDIDLLSIELREKDECKGMVHISRCVGKDIAHPNPKPVVV